MNLSKSAKYTEFKTPVLNNSSRLTFITYYTAAELARDAHGK